MTAPVLASTAEAVLPAASSPALVSWNVGDSVPKPCWMTMLPQQPAVSTGVPLDTCSVRLLSPNAIDPLPTLAGADHVAPPSVEVMPHGPSTPLAEPPKTAGSAPFGMTARPGTPFGEPDVRPVHASACTCGPTCPDGLIPTAPPPRLLSPHLVFVSKATCNRPSADRANPIGRKP